MIYGTGGGAWGSEERSGQVAAANFFTSSITTSSNDTVSGWVAGGGIEFMATANWLLRLEYLHYQFNSGGSVTAACSSCVAGPLAGSGTFTWGNSSLDTIRGALSYKFGDTLYDNRGLVRHSVTAFARRRPRGKPPGVFYLVAPTKPKPAGEDEPAISSRGSLLQSKFSGAVVRVKRRDARVAHSICRLAAACLSEFFGCVRRGGISARVEGAAGRQNTTAAWAIAHSMVFAPGALSVIACPAQRQSAEAIRRVRDAIVTAGAELKSDNVYGLEIKNGWRAPALPSSDDLIAGCEPLQVSETGRTTMTSTEMIPAFGLLSSFTAVASFGQNSPATNQEKSPINGNCSGSRIRPDTDAGVNFVVFIPLPSR